MSLRSSTEEEARKKFPAAYALQDLKIVIHDFQVVNSYLDGEQRLEKLEEVLVKISDAANKAHKEIVCVRTKTKTNNESTEQAT